MEISPRDIIKNFEPQGGPKGFKLDSRRAMVYLRVETAYKEAATDILEYVDLSDKRDMALAALFNARELTLQAVVGDIVRKDNQTQKIELEKKKVIKK